MITLRKKYSQLSNRGSKNNLPFKEDLSPLKFMSNFRNSTPLKLNNNDHFILNTKNCNYDIDKNRSFDSDSFSDFEEYNNSNSILNQGFFESFNDSYICEFNFNSSYFSNNEIFDNCEEAFHSSLNDSTNILNIKKIFNNKEENNTLEDVDVSIDELIKKIENINVEKKNGNCCLKKAVFKKKFSKNASYLSEAGNSGDAPERNFSSESVNKRLTLCRRQSHRVLPLNHIPIYENTFFRTLYINDLLENVRCDQNNNKNINQISFYNNYEDEDKFKKSVLKKCNQTEPLDFESFYNKKFSGKCKKIGEGVFGEVFSFNNLDRQTVIKIIPIEGDQLINDEPQKTFQDIFSEIVITQELSNLRNGVEFSTSCFIELIGIYCLKGEYPNELITLWNNFLEENGSENDSPDIFNNDQLFIILELDNGGLDLEAFEFINSSESYSIFKQLTFALAVAECALEFEHRDLHWGNLLISRTNNDKENFILFDQTYSIPTNGVKVSIIDFTLSRMTYDNCCVYNDLALDPTLFEAKGDYQFEIYRKMRSKLCNKWEIFEPYNNILWLHYILDKMKKQVRYKKTKSNIHKSCLIKLNFHFDNILNNESATNYAFNKLFS